VLTVTGVRAMLRPPVGAYSTRSNLSWQLTGAAIVRPRGASQKTRKATTLNMRTRSLLVVSLLGVLACQANRTTFPEIADGTGSATTADAIEAAMPAAAVPKASPVQPLSANARNAPESPAPVEAVAGQQEEDFQDEADRLRIIKEKQRYLAEQYIRLGGERLERADLEGALREYAQALEVMPGNVVAQQGLRRVQALLGDDFQQAAEGIEDAYQQAVVRRTQARLEAEQRVREGNEFERAGRHDDAITSYRRALSILQFHPLIADDSLTERQVLASLQRVAREAEVAESRAAENERSEAARVRDEREAEQRTRREATLRGLYSQAHSAFQREDFSLAETLSEQILLYDPGNPSAQKLRDIARAARHQATDANTHRSYRENWIRTFEDLNISDVPQTETIVFDLKRWREAIQRRPHEFIGADPIEQADKKAILQRLSELRVPARFGVDGDGAPLDEVASYLQNVTGVNFIVSSKVRDELDEEETAVLLDLPERSVRQLLDIITEVRDNLAYKVEDGVVKFVTNEELIGGQVLRFYEVRDLIRPVTDFPAREINIQPSGGTPEIDEEFDDREALIITEDNLEPLIRDNIAPDSWDADPNNSLTFSQGTMVVYQTPEVQEKIRKLLDDLREATGIMVDIQARFITVEDNFLEDIGVDFRGLGAPGLGTNSFFNDFGDSTAQQTLGRELGSDTDLGAFLDENDNGDLRGRSENLFDSFLGDEDVLTGAGGLGVQWTYLSKLQLEMILTATSKSERVELVTAPRVLVFNTARSNLSVVNQVAYVQDFDVEIAQAASIADPIINIVEDGVILDVRPVVSADRRFLTLEVRPTVAQLQRPIRNFTTSLGVSGNSVTIQLPELDISRVRTSIPMPDGGTILLGGMKVHESQDLRSGVPILNKLPIFSFLFQRQGTFITNRKLLILLKASIVIPQEHEPTPSQLGFDSTLSLEPN